MKILVLSDSHSAMRFMCSCVEKIKPQAIVHLGDYYDDGETLKELYPHIPIHQVPGNCDYRFFEETERILFIEDKRILICHGHTLGVKQSLMRAAYKSEEENLDLLLFGHTHLPMVDLRGKTWFVNPGSIGDYFHPFYAVVTIENGKIDAHTYPLNPSV